ncbi:MAG: lipoate protein ligase C-terminal domain-containing protein [Candidatus Woesearchaeota archaeon]
MIGEIDYKVPNGKLLRIQAVFDDSEREIIKDVKITGDFFIHPEQAIFEIENLIRGKRIRDLKKILNSYLEKNKIIIIGFEVQDILNALKEINKKQF